MYAWVTLGAAAQSFALHPSKPSRLVAMIQRGIGSAEAAIIYIGSSSMASGRHAVQPAPLPGSRLANREPKSPRPDQPCGRLTPCWGADCSACGHSQRRGHNVHSQVRKRLQRSPQLNATPPAKAVARQRHIARRGFCCCEGSRATVRAHSKILPAALHVSNAMHDRHSRSFARKGTSERFTMPHLRLLCRIALDDA